MKKIKAVKLYQPANFDKEVISYFTIATTPNKIVIKEINLIDGLGVEVKSATDHIIVPFSNVIAIQLWNDKDDKHEQFLKDEKAKAVGVKVQDIKRPR